MDQPNWDQVAEKLSLSNTFLKSKIKLNYPKVWSELKRFSAVNLFQCLFRLTVKRPTPSSTFLKVHFQFLCRLYNSYYCLYIRNIAYLSVVQGISRRHMLTCCTMIWPDLKKPCLNQCYNKWLLEQDLSMWTQVCYIIYSLSFFNYFFITIFKIFRWNWLQRGKYLSFGLAKTLQFCQFLLEVF